VLFTHIATQRCGNIMEGRTMAEFPDNWVVLKIKSEKYGVVYKILAGWSGGYTTGDSWRMNSGITNVRDEGDRFIFEGYSGSEYSCGKGSYCLRMNNAGVWTQLQEKHGDKVEMMDEDTDWMNMDWIIG